MRRRQLVEIHELAACPDVLRRLATEYLHTVGNLFRAFSPITPILGELARETHATAIVDLCSGAGGPALFLARELAREPGTSLDLVLTDLHPNRAAFERAERTVGARVRGEPEPIDARAVPERLVGIRTLFDAFHHFPEEDARRILADAARTKTPILIVEGTERTLRGIAVMLVAAPLLTLLLTPFVRPLTWWRVALTYLIPVAPLLILFDGVVSCLRTYTRDELRAMTRDLSDGYCWHIGVTRTRGQPLLYVVGKPR